MRVGILVGTGLAALLLSACAKSDAEKASDAAEAASQAASAASVAAVSAAGGGASPSDISGYAVLAKQKMADGLMDPEAAKYKDVHAYAVNGAYVFCGQINGKNGYGGYTGYERFIASSVIVGTEGNVTGFNKVWRQFCSPSKDAGPYAF